MDTPEENVSACMTFPRQHRAKVHSTKSIERPNGEIRPRRDGAGIFPNEASIRCLVGAILMAQKASGPRGADRLAAHGTPSVRGDLHDNDRRQRNDAAVSMNGPRYPRRRVGVSDPRKREGTNRKKLQRFTVEPIIPVLNEKEAGAKFDEPCRRQRAEGSAKDDWHGGDGMRMMFDVTDPDEGKCSAQDDARPCRTGYRVARISETGRRRRVN